MVADRTARRFNTAVYNIVPPPDDAGLLAFKIFLFDTPQFTVLSARTGGDYGLDATTTSIYHGSFPLQTLPAGPLGRPRRPQPTTRCGSTQLQSQRQRPPPTSDTLCDATGADSTADPNTVVQPCITNFRLPAAPLQQPARRPFLQNPTTCDDPLRSSLEVLSYDGGTDHAETPWPQMTGCDQLSFNPSLYAQPTTRRPTPPRA